MRRMLSAIGGIALLYGGTVQAQSWPQRPIRIVVPYGPASSPDVVVRAFSDRLGQRLGQPVIVENRPGAGGNTGTDIVAKAAPDGYTLVISTNGPLVYNTVMYKKLPYDPFTDLAPITLAAVQPNVCVANTALGARSVREWIEVLRKNPGKFNFSSTGVGSMSQLAIEIIKLRTNTFAVHIPYASSPLAVTAMLQGDVHMACLPPVAVMPQVKAGKLTALAVTSGSRNPLLPEVPTLKESGFPEIEAIAWMAILAPAKTPSDVIDTLSREITQALRLPETVERLQRAYIDVVAGTSAALGEFMRAELRQWTPVIKRSGAIVD